MVLTVNPPATANAGPTATICETSTFPLTAAVASNYSALLWTRSGTGTFDDNTIQNPVYTPSAADIAAGSVTLTLTATGLAACTPAVHAMTLNISRQVVASAGSDGTVCQTNPFNVTTATQQFAGSLLWTHNGAGVLTDPGTLIPIYTPDINESGIVTLTLTANPIAPCAVVIDEMELTVNPQTTANAGPDVTICETGTYTLTSAVAADYASLLWTTAGDGTFDDDLALQPTYTPGAADIAAGSVDLTLTSFAFAACSDASDAIKININKQAAVGAGPDETVCQDNTIQLKFATPVNYASILWTHDGAGTLATPTAVMPIYTPDPAETGIVTFTLTAYGLAPCVDVSDQLELTVNEAALADAGPPETICEGSTYTLAASSASGFAGLLWTTPGDGSFDDASLLHPTYTPGVNDITSGAVSLTFTAFGNPTCNDVTSLFNLSITRQVTVDAGSNATICQTSTFSPTTAVSQFYDHLVWTHNGSGSISNDNTLTPVYTPGAGETGTITLTLTAFALAPCTDVTDQMQLTINEAAQAFAGTPATICETSTFTLASSTASGYASLLWTTSGTGGFSNSTDLHPVYTPSVADIAAGSVTLTLTSIAFASCTDASSAITLNITRQVTVDAGNNATICQTSTFSPTTAVSQFYDHLVWTHNGSGNITSDNTLTPVYTPGAGETGTITLTLTAYALTPCADVTDQMQLTINEAAQAFAGAGATICEGSTYTLAASTASGYASLLWTSSGTGGFSNSTALHPVYTPSVADIAAGSVTLTLTSIAFASCTNANSDLTLNITRQATANAGPDGQVCQNATFTVTSAIANFQSSLLWTHTGTGTIINANTISPSYTPGAGESGNIIFTLTSYANAPCANANDQMVLAISEAAGSYGGANATVCEGSTYTLADATASGYTTLAWNTTGTGSFSNNTALHPVYSPSAGDIATGSVVLTLTSIATPPCLNSSSSMTLNITRQVTANAGADGQVCQNTPYVISGATSQNYNTINWTHTGLGTLNDINTLTPTYTPAASESGTILLTLHGLANSPCADASDDMQLTIHPLPVANAGPDAFSCQGFNYTIAGASGLHYSTVSWTENGAGSLLNPTTLSPTYVPGPGETGNVTLTLTIMGTASCAAESSTDTRIITITPLPDVDAGSDATICASNTLTLNAVQTFCSSVLWTTSGNGTFADASQSATVYTPGSADIAAGTVTLTFTGNGTGTCSGLTDVDQITVTVDPMPAIDAGPDGSHCVQAPIAISGTSASNYATFSWTTSGDGTFNNPLNLSPTYMPGNIDFNNGIVTLTLTAQGRLSCASKIVTDTRILNVAPYPIINAGPDDYICSNVTQFQLNGTGNHYNLANIQWTVSGGDGTFSNPNIMNPIYFAGPVDLSTPNRSIIFTLTLQGNGSCSGILVNDQIELKIDPTPVSNAGPDDATCDERPYQLNASGQYQSTLTWTTSGDGFFNNINSFTPTYTPGPNDVGNTVVLTLQLQGCKNIIGGDFMWLSVHPDPTVTISGSDLICEGETTPISIDFTGTPPWSVTYTNGAGTPVTVSNINATPYTFNVTPPVTSTWWVTAANDINCSVPADSIFGLASISVNALPHLFTVTGSNSGNYCEGDTGVIIGLNNSQLGMEYELLRNGLAIGYNQTGTGSAFVFGIFTTPGLYSIRGTNPLGNCIAMMKDTINVVMNPIPVTDFTTNIPCSNDTTYFTLTGNYLPRTSAWHWNFGDGTFATYNAPYNPSHLYPTYGTYIVTLSVVDTNGCQYTVSHPVEVKPHPNAFFSFNTPNCMGGITQFTDLSNNPAGQGYLQQWTWSFGDGSPEVTINFPSSPNITHTYTAPGNYNVTLTVLNSRGCTSVYQSVISVFNRPIADFNYWSGCQNQEATFIDNSLANLGGQISGYLWNFGDPTSGALNTSTLKNPVHTYATAGNFQVQLIVTNLNGCRDTTEKTVVVNASPLSDFFSSPGCLNSATQFLADSTVINIPATASYLWNFGDGATSGNQNTSHVYLSAGTFTVTLTITDTAGCEGVKTRQVTVNPPPTALFSANTDNCQGQSVAFFNQSTSVSGFINKWIWNYGDGITDTVTFPANPNVSHTYATTGNFSVSLKVINSEGCSHTRTIVINMLGAPTSDFASSGQCEGSSVSFSDLSSVSGLQNITSWKWNFGDPTSGVFNTSTQQNPSHTFAAAGTYPVKLITFTGNNCSDTITKDIIIRTKPAVDFSVQSACANNPASFTPTGMTATAISTWNWNFGDGGTSTAQSPTYVYTSAGTYTVTLTVTDTSGCSNTRSKPVIIIPLPFANFGYSTPTCQGDAVNFSDLSTAASGFVARWVWDFGDGNIQTINFPGSPNVSHQYGSSGTFNVTLTVKTSDSCTNLLTRVVTILPKPSAEFAHGAACQGNAVTFNDLSISNTTGTINGWNWNFGDPTSGTANNSTLQHPNHIYNTAGTYTVSLIVSIPGGCSDTIMHQVVVGTPPTVDFTPVAGCNGDTTLFTSSTLVNMPATQGWYWQFGDGTTSFVADPVHIYNTAGTYTVTLTITDTAGCTNTKTKPVIVIPGPIASFSASTPACSGTPITLTDLSNANGGSLSAWHWDFGDGTDTTYNSSLANLNHIYTQSGTFVVTLQVSSAQGCESATQQTVTISAAPVAGFDFSNTCQGQSTQFTDMSSLNGGNIITQRSWNFGDPASGVLNTSTSVNPVHNYALPGQYVVTLTTLNASGCLDTLQKNVAITPKPGVDFYNDSLTCLGSLTTLFTDTIATNIPSIQYYEWDFGDGSPHAFTRNASHTYTVAGTFTVTLTVSDTAGCQNIKSKPLTIHTAATPLFSYSGICQDAPTQFTDLSVPPQGENIASWYWEFGSPADTSTMQNPDFSFALPGSYAVKLVTTTENGCSSSKVMPVQIWNKPSAHFKYTASPCANGLVQFQDSSWSYQGTVNSWQWEFEPYQYGSGQNPSHQYYAVDSCYLVTLMIEDMRGCMDTTQIEICVPPPLTVDFSTNLTCFGSPVTFTPEMLTPEATADSLITFSWNFGDPTTGTNNVSTVKKPNHTFSKTGFYTVNFTTTDQFGCTATAFKTVQVNALPVAGFTYTTGQCDSTLIFSSSSVDTSSVISTYIWQYGDGTSDTLSIPASIHKYSVPGEYYATLTIINENGCTDSYSDTVTRSSCLVAAYLTTEELLCQNQELTFMDMSTCDGTIAEWVWDFGDGTLPTTYTTYKPAVSHTFMDPGTFTISLKVSTLVGTQTISDSTSVDILVKPSPLAGFTVNPVCLGTKAEFNDTTQANGATALMFKWEFGDAGIADTSNLRNPKYLYTVPDLYQAMLIVTNQFGCSDTAANEVLVNGLPDAIYTNSIACAGQKTYFFDGSQPYVEPLGMWGWRVSDSLGFIGSMQGDKPSYTFSSAGNYEVRLTVADINGCTDTLIQQVEVNSAPVSAFTVTENVDNIQGQVQFTNGSIGAIEYFWDFGNGETSYDISPTITYAEDGIYNVNLVTVNKEGCHDTATISYDMLFKGLYVPNAFAPGGTVQATRYWKPVGINLASYRAEVYNSYGALLWSSTKLDEEGRPTESWDGTFNQKPSQQDVYVWKIRAIFRDGSIWYNADVGEREGLSEPRYGTISLIR